MVAQATPPDPEPTKLAGAARPAEPVLPQQPGVPAPPTGSVDPSLSQARAKFVRPPKYPLEAWCNGVEGTVVLLIDLDESGHPSRIIIERSSRDRSLDRSAYETAKTWVFSPRVVNGKAVPSVARVPVAYHLPQIRPGRCPNISSVTLSRTVDPTTKKALEPADVFETSDTVHVVLEHAMHGEHRVDLFWQNMDRPEMLEGHSESLTVIANPDQAIEAGYAPPGGWKAGNYRLELQVDNVLVEFLPFEVR